jgi:3-hexulose-6-phosphate synthase/6-phospho-3-hexuloisomerase
MNTIVQISLDIVSIPEAIETAHLAIRSGVDWLEAGTPLIIAEGMNGVRALHSEFPGIPIVADLKTMDGGWLEAQLMAEAGATHVVVMERAHPETVKMVVKAGRDFGIKVMGDNLGAEDKVAAAKRLEDLGCDFVIHHVGYDERRGLAAAGKPFPSPLDLLREIVAAVRVPVQAVGGSPSNRRSAHRSMERLSSFSGHRLPSMRKPSKPPPETWNRSFARSATASMLTAVVVMRRFRFR